jgi:hypothetical protein
MSKYTSKFSPAAALPLLIISISLVIFFIPMALGQKSHAIDASVKQNMDFFKETVDKYISRHHHPPKSIKDLYEDAKKNNYNKTFFNPLSKHTGDMNNLQIIVQYNAATQPQLNANFVSKLYAGKVGYWSHGIHYTLYGHGQEGKLLQENHKLLQMGNY